MRAFGPLLAVLCLSVCGDPGTVPAPPPPPAPTPIAAPQVASRLPDLELTAGGPTVVVDLSQAISGEVTQWSATSSDSDVAVVTVGNDGRAEVQPMRAGAVQITINARNAGGTAETTFAVRVLAQASTAPAVVGVLQPATLGVGGASFSLDLAGAFSPPGFTLAVRSLDPGVVTASVSGTLVTLTPISAGSTTVEVTAGNTAGSAARALPVTVVARPAVAGSLEPLALVAGSASTVIDLSPAFSPAAGLSFRAVSDDPEIVAAAVAGAELTITPLEPGATEITITAQNAAGSTTRGIPVIVVAEDQASAPRPVGTLPPLTLATASGPVFVDIGAAFTPQGFRLEARSGNPRVATVSVHADAALRVTPVSAGRTAIAVTALNTFGSGSRELRVEVVGPPAVASPIRPLSLTIGAPPTVVDLRGAFSPPGFDVETRSLNERVATASLEAGPSLKVTPVGAGTTAVEITARNAGGSATQTVRVTVAATAPRAVGTLAPVALSVGGAPVQVDVAGSFTPAGVPVEVRSLNPRFVTATVNGTVVTLTPVAAGDTSVEVTARNASGSAKLSISVTVAVGVPKAVGVLAPVSLTVGGAAREVDVAAAFTPAGVPIEVRSLNPGVVTATSSGSVVTLAPVNAGNTSVEVTARNASGSATLSLAVTVGVSATPVPQAVGTLAPLSLTVGGDAVEVDVAAAFTPAGVPIEVRSLDTQVATATVRGSVVTLTPVAAGDTSVEVTARNGSGSATLSISVTVAAPEAPSIVGQVGQLSFIVGEAARRFDTQRWFTPAGVSVESRPLDPGIVTVAVEGSALTVTPVGPGRTSVVVTARNPSGSATLTITVTVAAEAPRAVGTPDPISLSLGGSALDIDLPGLFTPAAVHYSYESNNPGIVQAELTGTVLTLTPATAGATTVAVDATNALGSATQTFSVTVTRDSALRAKGRLAPVSLTVGGESAEVDVADAFTPAGFTVTASSSRETVATVTVDGTLLTIAPVGEGTATIHVNARNASGTARTRISVTVAADASATVELADVTLSVGGETLDVDVAGAFAFASFTVDARSRDTRIVTVEVSGTVLTLTPVSAGRALVNVIARPESGASSTKSFYVTVLPMAPRAVGAIEPVTLRDEGPAVEVDVADAFTPSDVSITARYTGNVANIGVAVEGSVVTVTPHSEGKNVVEVTARNAAGSATQTFAVTVLPVAPKAVGTVEAVELIVGGASVQRSFRERFDGWWTRLRARSDDRGIVTATTDNDRWVTFTPVGEGNTSVVVTARNAGGSASHTVPLTVTTAVPEKIGSLGPAKVILRGHTLKVYIADIFTPATARVEAESSDTRVVTAKVTTDGPDREPIVRVTPIGLGTTTVVITGSTSEGSESYTWEITVVAPG